MNETLYIMGEKFSGGYPDGRYVCTLLPGKVWDYYIVSAVLEYPSVRAVANPDAWSNAKIKGYGDLFYYRKGIDKPEVYTGNLGTSEEEYNLSLVAAIEKSMEDYNAKGDMEAVDRLRGKLEEAVMKVQSSECIVHSA